MFAKTQIIKQNQRHRKQTHSGQGLESRGRDWVQRDVWWRDGTVLYLSHAGGYITFEFIEMHRNVYWKGWILQYVTYAIIKYMYVCIIYILCMYNIYMYIWNIHTHRLWTSPSEKLGWSLRICISKKFSEDPDATYLAIFWEPLIWPRVVEHYYCCYNFLYVLFPLPGMLFPERSTDSLPYFLQEHFLTIISTPATSPPRNLLFLIYFAPIAY